MRRTGRDADPVARGARRDVSLQDLVDQTMGTTLSRADLLISRTGDGELLVTSRQDGTIRILVPETVARTSR